VQAAPLGLPHLFVFGLHEVPDAHVTVPEHAVPGRPGPVLPAPPAHDAATDGRIAWNAVKRALSAGGVLISFTHVFTIRPNVAKHAELKVQKSGVQMPMAVLTSAVIGTGQPQKFNTQPYAVTVLEQFNAEQSWPVNSGTEHVH